MPAATAAGAARVEQRPLGRAHLDRPVGAGVRRRLRVGQDAHREVAGRARHRASGQLRLPACCARAAGEVEHDPLARDGGAHAQLEVALGRLDDVARLAHAVAERGDRGAARDARRSRAPTPAPPRARSGPRRRASASSRRAPTTLAASWARRSARRSAGWRMRATSAVDQRRARAAAARSRRPPPRACGCRPASSRRSRPPTSAWCARVAAKPIRRPSRYAGVTTVMSGRWVPPANGSLRIQLRPGACVALAHRRDRGGHRAEVHRDVLGLHDHLAARVEQRARGVAALLDVRRVRGPDQQRAHLLAGRVQRAEDDRAARSGPGRPRPFMPASARSCRRRRRAPRQPGVTSSVASGSAQTAGPSIRSPGAGSPAISVASSSRRRARSAASRGAARGALRRAARAPAPAPTPTP